MRKTLLVKERILVTIIFLFSVNAFKDFLSYDSYSQRLSFFLMVCIVMVEMKI